MLACGIVAVVYVGRTWWNKTQTCNTECILKGSAEGKLRFSGGGRLNAGAYCECVGVAKEQ